MKHILMRPSIVILGGGFAGVACAKTLQNAGLWQSHDLILFNHENHLVFSPLLPEVAGGSLDPRAAAAPLRQMLRHVRCRTEDIVEVDAAAKAVIFEGEDGECRRLPYDQLVLACGSTVNLTAIPGMANHAYPLKTIGDGVALRNHVLEMLEHADVCDNAERREWYLNFIIVGGGFSGVETAGEINDLVLEALPFFPNLRGQQHHVHVVHGLDEILPELGMSLRRFAREKMTERGICFHLQERVSLVTPTGVGLQNGGTLKGATIVSTIGTSPAPVIERLKLPKERGRLIVQSDMRVGMHSDLWAVGDCAHVVNAYDGSISPQTGQYAERQGRQVARNILRVLNHEPTKAFYFKPIGSLCSIGGRSAVAEIQGVQASGFWAWFLWRGVYLFKTPTWSRRVRVGLDWAWDLFFERDLAHFRTQTSERVAKAFFNAGDYIFRQGDPATNFYIIERGEVEILSSDNGGVPRSLAVLKAGDFFGEMALINQRPRSASVRAKTLVEVVVMGSEVFKQVSKSLSPLNDLIIDTVQKRSRTSVQTAEKKSG